MLSADTSGEPLAPAGYTLSDHAALSDLRDRAARVGQRRRQGSQTFGTERQVRFLGRSATETFRGSSFWLRWQCLCSVQLVARECTARGSSVCGQ